MPATERAIVFVDGNNWYHGLKNAGFSGLGWLNYAKVSRKIVGAREWVRTRYYVGQVQQRGNTALYADQRRYLAWLKARDRRISVHFGRLEERLLVNEFAREMKRYLANLTVRIDAGVYKHLISEANRHEHARVVVEKAVDVMLAVDLVRMADRNEYDTAHLLAADGDYTPAVEAAMTAGKKVFAAAITPGAELAKVAYRYLPLSRDWFHDCFGE
jgi:uncharacterized LabA/DUF88 family protein